MGAHHIQILTTVDVSESYALTAHVDVWTVPFNVFHLCEREHAMFERLRDEIVPPNFNVKARHR